MKNCKILFITFFTFHLSFLNCINPTLEDSNSWTKPFKTRNITTNQETSNILLFEEYPKLQKYLPHVNLGNFPTPIKKLNNLEQEIKYKNIYLKNDGLSNRLFGGNKIRKLEFLLAEALYNGSKTVITFGAAGSNHTIATIINAKKLSLNAISMLTPQLNTSYLRRNLLLSLYYKGQLFYYPNDVERLNSIPALVEKIKKEDGQYPYIIPVGGSSPLGTLGFVNAAFELKQQIQQKQLPSPDYIYITMGSTGSAAGLLLGLKLANIDSKIIAVRVSGQQEYKINTLKKEFKQTNELLHSLDDSCPIITKFPGKNIFIHHDFLGDRYAQITQQTAEGIQLLNDTENIKLDGSYTGKTFAALLHDIKKYNLKNKVILFWNTYCSGNFSEITNKVDYKKLPMELHKYFETDLQQLDQGC